MRKIISEKKLDRIFNHYKNQYNLNTEIDILQEGWACNYSRNTDYIFLGINHIFCISDLENLQKRSKNKSDNRIILFVLLHEIKHAIDYTTNRKKFDEEFSVVNIGLYIANNKYHDSRPFEKRADTFARQELKRWV